MGFYEPAQISQCASLTHKIIYHNVFCTGHYLSIENRLPSQTAETTCAGMRDYVGLNHAGVDFQSETDRQFLSKCFWYGINSLRLISVHTDEYRPSAIEKAA